MRVYPPGLRYPVGRDGEVVTVSDVPKLTSSKLRTHIPSEIILKVPVAMTADPTDGGGVFFQRFEVPSYWILEIQQISIRTMPGESVHKRT